MEISRRGAIMLGGLSVAGLVVAAPERVAGQVRANPRQLTGEVLRQPRVLASRGGRLRVELVAAPRGPRVGHATGKLGFNGTSPGPTLRMRPGDELAVRLTNHLDQPTNLHTHGLRVSPQHNSDNPFLQVDPGTSFDYLIRLAPDHPTGTFWYHPHHHGMVADQVFGGLFGALLVEPRSRRGSTAVDRVLLVSDITLDGHGRVARAGGMDKMMGRQGRLVLVNGAHRPTIPAVPGAPQRWRIINACASRVLALRLQGHDLAQIAVDGTFLPAPSVKDRVVLAPGNRADVIIRPTKAGHYDLIAEPFEDLVDTVLNLGEPVETVTLATMTTAGPPASAPPLPLTLPAETPPGAPATVRRQITIQMGMGGMDGNEMTFTIDGRSFDPARDDQTVVFGTTEEWTISNDSPLPHPFHLHTWPFIVQAISDLTPPSGVAQDVVLIPAHGWVILKIPFTAHSGRSVFHCHTLDHGDGGMMATVNVRR
jgi:FtsP/CotA-like multicopper oxidase with cupredoxin domain